MICTEPTCQYTMMQNERNVLMEKMDTAEDKLINYIPLWQKGQTQMK